MSRPRHTRAAARIPCARCKVAIAGQRSPVFLMVASGAIVGPFHAGCAERLVLEAKRQPDTNWLKGFAEYGRYLPAEKGRQV